MSTFDQAVSDLRQEKFKLTSDLKATDLKLLTQYHELQLLKGFEAKESELMVKLKRCRTDKAQVCVRVDVVCVSVWSTDVSVMTLKRCRTSKAQVCVGVDGT